MTAGSMREQLLSLAERCEKAEGPDDRELDCRIRCAINGENFEVYSHVVPDFEQWLARPYTTSVDSALTLVPEGWSYTICPKWAEVRHPVFWAQDQEGHAASPALALTAASLRARAAKAREAGQ